MGEERTSNVGKATPANKSSKSASKTTNTRTTSAATGSTAIPEKIDIVWAVAFIVVAFVIGFFVRGLFLPAQPGTTAPAVSSESSGALTEPATGGTSGVQQAPALDESQLNKPLPTGHPTVGGSTGATAPAAAGSGTTGDAGSDSFTHQPGGGAITPTENMGNVQSDVPAADSAGSNSLEVKKDPSKTTK